MDVKITLAIVIGILSSAVLAEQWSALKCSTELSTCSNSVQTAMGSDPNMEDMFTSGRESFCKKVKDVDWSGLKSCIGNIASNCADVAGLDSSLELFEVMADILEKLCHDGCKNLEAVIGQVDGCLKDTKLESASVSDVTNLDSSSEMCTAAKAVGKCLEGVDGSCPLVNHILKDAVGKGAKANSATNIAVMLHVPPGLRAIDECGLDIDLPGRAMGGAVINTLVLLLGMMLALLIIFNN